MFMWVLAVASSIRIDMSKQKGLDNATTVQQQLFLVRLASLGWSFIVDSAALDTVIHWVTHSYTHTLLYTVTHNYTQLHTITHCYT